MAVEKACEDPRIWVEGFGSPSTVPHAVVPLASCSPVEGRDRVRVEDPPQLCRHDQHGLEPPSDHRPHRRAGEDVGSGAKGPARPGQEPPGDPLWHLGAGDVPVRRRAPTPIRRVGAQPGLATRNETLLQAKKDGNPATLKSLEDRFASLGNLIDVRPFARLRAPSA